MSHKEKTGMADLDMPQFESVPGVIKGYAHKRVSKDGFQTTLLSCEQARSVLLVVTYDFPHACLPCL